MGSSQKHFLQLMVITIGTSLIIPNSLQNINLPSSLDSTKYEYSTVEIETHKVADECPSTRNFTDPPCLEFQRQVIITILNCELPLDQPLLETFNMKPGKSITELRIVHQCTTNDRIQNANRMLFHGLRQLKKLHWIVSSKSVQIDQNAFIELVNLNILYITGAVTSNLESDLFKNQKNLEYLFITENDSFETIPFDLIVNNRKLRTFSLTFSELTIETLPNKFLANLPSLLEVHLNNNQISKISVDVFNGSNNISYLNLSHNKLTSIPEDLLIDQGGLERCYLENNKIETLPDGLFRNAQRLQVLWLADNRLQHLSGTLFTSLGNLVELNLENNNLHTIDRLVFQCLTALQKLNVQNNHLTFDSTSFQYLSSSIQVLNLRNNSITAIPNDFTSNLSQLEQLDISYNAISNLSIADLQFLSSNASVDLSHNKITTISLEDFDGNTSYKNIIEINLNNNPLSCDCNMFGFVQYLQAEENQQIRFVTNDFRCAEPAQLSKILLNRLQPWQLICPLNEENQICPANCSCSFRPGDRSDQPKNTEYNWNLILISVSLLMVALLAGIVLYFKNQTKVKILLYNNNF